MATASMQSHRARPQANGDERGRVLPLTRAGIWVLLVLAALNGLFLYFVPAQAETHYAWSIKPSVNAAFIGAGFLAGTVATGLVLAYATRWRSFSTLPIALWVLATTLLAATIIHNDRFKFDYAPTWVWTFVYAAVPIAIPFLVAPPERERRRGARPGPEAHPAADRLGRLRRRHPGRRDRALPRPRRARPALAVAAHAAARPRRGRLVHAVRDDAGQLRVGMRRAGRRDHPLRDARLMERAPAAAAGAPRRAGLRRRRSGTR